MSQLKDKKTKRSKLTWNRRCCLWLLPSLLGTIIFFVWPFIRVLYYSMIDNQFSRRFVGLDNYIRTIKNTYFQLAWKNSLLIIAIAVPVLVLLAILLSVLLSSYLKKVPRIRDGFIIPMLIPTASIVLIWQQLFETYESALPIYMLFVWKNIGICIILLTAALTTIDHSIYEAAKMDGAKLGLIHRKITIPIIAPTIFFVVLLSIVNSFKIFKESYLYYGNKYPPNYSYTLQYYMNNNFLKFNYQALATSSVITTALILVIIGVGLKMQRRFQS